MVQCAFKWDAENRLIEVSPASPVSGSKKVVYTYDYLGRRVQRNVYSWNPTGGGGSGAWNTTADESQRLIYYNWLPLVELNGLSGNAVLRRWTWGLDLAGLSGSQNSVDQAGGIGGLLATYDTSASKGYVYFHDGNGNVGQLIDPLASTASASLVARYEYDAYGNVTSSGGSYAATNRMRFSTKPWDAVTELEDAG